jgi:hypothetical protein
MEDSESKSTYWTSRREAEEEEEEEEEKEGGVVEDAGASARGVGVGGCDDGEGSGHRSEQVPHQGEAGAARGWRYEGLGHDGEEHEMLISTTASHTLSVVCSFSRVRCFWNISCRQRMEGQQCHMQINIWTERRRELCSSRGRGDYIACPGLALN